MSFISCQKHKSANSNRFPRKTALAAAVGLVLSGPAAVADTFTVTNLDSGITTNGSLAWAIDEANTNPGADDIHFEDGLSGIITIDTSGSGEGSLVVTDHLTVTGPGRDVISVVTSAGDGACESGCSDLFTVELDGSLAISGLTLDSSNPGFSGSLIDQITGALTIEDCALLNSGGHTTTGGGGAIVIGSSGGLTIRNSTLTGHKSTGNGGAIAIYGESDFRLENSTVSGNYAGLNGGGIYLSDVGLVDVLDSTIGGNTAGGHGGGVYYDPSAFPDLPFALLDSTVSGNSATNNGGGLYVVPDAGDTPVVGIDTSVFSGNNADGTGGGVAALTPSLDIAGATLQLAISSSVFDNNEAFYRGGGIAVSGNAPTGVWIAHSTISNNRTTYTADPDSLLRAADSNAGGGLFIRGNDMDLEVINTTVSGNANSDSDGNGGGGIYLYSANEGTPLDADFLHVTITGNASPNNSGGGIITRFSHWNGNVTLVNSIVAGNSAPNGPDISSTAEVVNVDYSLIGDGSDANLTEITMSNIIGTTAAPADPMLDALADNGGTRAGAGADVPLRTHAVLEGSPVIGAADQSVNSLPDLDLPAFDQRGLGFERIRDGGLDMGAVEYIESAGDGGGNNDGNDNDNDNNDDGGGSGSGGNTRSSPGGGGGGGGASGPVLLFSLLAPLGLRRRKG